MNIELKENYNQVCVWPGTVLKEDQVGDFVSHFAENGFRIQHLETVITAPDVGDPESGGRHDLLFAVHDEDIMRFAIPRLQMGIRWIEDALDNESDNHSIYPERVKEYRTW